MAAERSKVKEPAVRKRSDAYTGFLAISFLAMVGGCVLLYLELQTYEGAKKPPPPPAIEVPGTQLKTIPGSGGPPKEVPKQPPADDGGMPKDMPKDMPMMRKAPDKPADTVPVVLPPAEATEPVLLPPLGDPLPTAKMTDPLIPIVELPPPPPAVEPVKAEEPVKAPTLKPIIPVVEPTLTDPPPLPGKRFDPPR